MLANGEVGHITLGSSDLEVSRLGFGTYQLGRKNDPAASLELLKLAVDHGITLFDTSDNYPSEVLLGLAIRDGVLPRDEVIIADKTGFACSEYEAREFQRLGRQQDTSADRIVRKVEQSLRILGVEAIDLYQVHALDPAVKPIEVVVTMNSLIRQGKIKHYGISNYNTSENVMDVIESCDVAGLTRPISLQNGYNLLNRYCKGSIETAQKLGMGVLAFSPLHKGVLTDRLFYNLDARKRELDISEHDLRELNDTQRQQFDDKKNELTIIEKLADLQVYASGQGGNLQHLAISWVLSQENIVPLIGAYRKEDFEDVVQAANWELDEEGLVLIDRVFADISKRS